jgi:hypothetical protein
MSMAAFFSSWIQHYQIQVKGNVLLRNCKEAKAQFKENNIPEELILPGGI